MAAPGAGASRKMETSESSDGTNGRPSEPIPGFSDTDAFVKYALGTVVGATRASNGLPQCGDEYDFYRSFPGFRAFCEEQGDRLLHCMSRIMQYHGCRSHLKDRTRVTALEDKYDLLVDANDAVLERVGMLLDEASGVSRNQQPILPAGLQAPKTIISSWNRKSNDSFKKGKGETFRLLHAKNIPRPQLRFKDQIDNSNTPFVPKIFVKPNAEKPLPDVLKNRRGRQQRPEDLDVPPALADFIHQQRMKQSEEDTFLHPYQYELDRFVPLESSLEKPEIQLYRPLNETPCHYIDTLDDLAQLNEKLLRCSEFALDLEHHSYRSFLGLTCLMQISTRTEDFIIDILDLRSDLYLLNESFTHPGIVKVLHGADSDIEWLQKDFGLYIVNLFDTHQASRLLNLGRNSLDHLLRHYCNVESDKKYQLADWRIRPLPEEMLQYARADTHYLLYIYDKMRTDLLDTANEQQTLLHLVWQRSKEICLKRFLKPIYTEDSYLELYQKLKRPLNTQQLTAFRLLFAWRDSMARQEDESTGYVLPNHMLMKISEELPKEPQGIIACCNPVPPLVRQQINELSLLVQQAREKPLMKTDATPTKKRGPMPNPEKMENFLFGPHDLSKTPIGQLLMAGAAVEVSTGIMFNDEDPAPPTLHSPVTVRLEPSITCFNHPEEDSDEMDGFSRAKKKARTILDSFDNPFRMFLPSNIRGAHASQAAKLDPNTKMFEISNRWRLVSIAQQEREAKARQEARQKRQAEKAAREKAKKELQKSAANVKSVRDLFAEEEGKKHERTESDLGTETPKVEKKHTKNAEAAEPVVPETFTPYDYSKSNFKVFAGKSKRQPDFDPNMQTPPVKQKNSSAKKSRQVAGKSMSFFGGKSDRGFRHSWPKR